MSDAELDVRERELALDAAVPIVTSGVRVGDYSKEPCLHGDVGGLFDALEKECSNFVLSCTKDDC